MHWSKRNDVELFDDKDYDRLFHLRDKFSSFIFSPDNVRDYLSHMYLVEQDYLEKITNHKEEFLNILEGTKQGWIISNGVVPTPAKTIAETILTCNVQPFLKSAKRFYDEENIPMFLMDVDFSFGMIEIPTAIIGASTEGEGGGQAAIDYGMIQTLKHYGPLPSSEADDLYIDDVKACRYYRKLFEKDQSANILLTSMISCLEAGDNAHTDEEYHRYILPMHNNKLYIAGSYFAKNVYGGLYALWHKENFTYKFI